MGLDHQIIWNQLTCTDLDAAIRFYGDLFGWETKAEERETYVHFYVGEQTVAGIMPDHGQSDGAASWVAHVGTSDVAAYCKRAEAAGGKALAPIMDIPSTGKLCPIVDPGGAVLVAFEPSDAERKSWAAQQAPGHFCWVELLTGDLAQALQFYGEVAGWRADHIDRDDFQYTLLAPPGSKEGQAVGGAVQKPAAVVSDQWLPHVAVESVDEKYALALQLGATSCVTPTEIAGHGKFAVLLDPQNALFAIYQGA